MKENGYLHSVNCDCDREPRSSKGRTRIVTRRQRTLSLDQYQTLLAAQRETNALLSQIANSFQSIRETADQDLDKVECCVRESTCFTRLSQPFATTRKLSQLLLTMKLRPRYAGAELPRNSKYPCGRNTPIWFRKSPTIFLSHASHQRGDNGPTVICCANVRSLQASI